MTSRYLPRIDSPGSGGGGPPPQIEDHFAPRWLVGNTPAGDPAIAQASPFEYIPDPGDGSGIALAVAAANLAGGGDIWIRPGLYDLGAGATVGFVVTASGVTIRGAGFGTVIRGRADMRSLFDFSAPTMCMLRDLAITLPVAAAGASGLQVVHCGAQNVVENIRLTADTPTVPNADESITAVFRDAGGGRHRNLYSLNTPFDGLGQVAAFDVSGANTMMSQLWSTFGDLALRLVGSDHRIDGLFSTVLTGGVSIEGDRHSVDMSVDSSVPTVPVVLVDAGASVSLRGKIRNLIGGGSGPAVQLGATAVRPTAQMVSFSGFATCIDILTGATNALALGCQFDGGVVADLGTLTELGHNQP